MEENESKCILEPDGKRKSDGEMYDGGNCGNFKGGGADFRQGAILRDLAGYFPDLRAD